MKFNVDDCNIVELYTVHEDNGNIIALENKKNIPFDIKRIYYLYDVPMNAERGGHAHYDLQQYVICGKRFFYICNR